MNSDYAPHLPVVLLGAGGHARVLLALLRASGRSVLGVCDPQLARESESQWRGLTVLGGDEYLATVDPSAAGVVIGVGQLVGQSQRRHLFERVVADGFACPVLVHPHSWVDSSVRVEQGAQVMAGVVIQPDASIGCNVIVNTGANIDHDCRIDAHAHIAPAATLCGDVRVGEGAFIGSGATVIQGISVGAGAVVGAGTVVTRNVPPGGRVLGAAVRRFDV